MATISCDPSDLANAARCFNSCGTDQLALKSYLLCQLENHGLGPTPPPVTCVNAEITAWAAKVIANGGAATSQNTQDAFCQFANGLITDGIDSRVLAYNGIAPDNLIAAITPQRQGTGVRNPYLNVGGSFVGADVSVNGLTGNNAVPKTIATGLSALNAYPSISNAGFSIYAYTASATGICFGAGDVAVSWHELAAKFSDTLTYDRNGGVGTLINVASPGNGFYSSQRTGTTTHNLYFASSVFPHASIGSEGIDVTGVPLSVIEMSLFTFDNGGVGSFPCSDTLSFFALTQGLSAAQDLLFFNRVQALRQALGGGFR